MGCCSSNLPEEAEADKGRKCTDKCWLVLFVLSWIVLSVAAVWSYGAGNPSRLIHGYDSFGNICGQKNKRIEGISWSGIDMTDCPYVFHMNPNDVSYTMKICVSQCADRNLTGDGDLEMFYQRSGSSLYRYDYDLNDRNREAFYSGIPAYDIAFKRHRDETQGFGPGPQVPVIKQRPLLSRCVSVGRIKTGEGGTVNNVYNYLKEMDIAHKMISDIYASWRNIAWTVLFGVAVAILVTFTIHYLASIVSTFIMIVSTVLLLSLTAFCWYVYFDIRFKLNLIPKFELRDDEILNEKTFLVFSILLTIITLIILFATYIMRKRVSLMIALFDETAACLRSMPALIFQPIWTSAVLLLFLTFWATVFLAISTAENDIKYNSTTTRFQLQLPARRIIRNGDGHVTFDSVADQYYLESVKHEQPPVVKYLWWFVLLMLFWSSEFILGCQQMTVASSVATWYFTRDKSTIVCPIGNSIRRVASYHLGSIALGSFLIVLFKIPRIIMCWMEHYLKTFRERYACVDCAFKCCHFMWYCLENFVRYINHNAYTIIAIEGTPYCFSAKVAFQTLTSNTLRILTINSMGDFIIFLGKCIVTTSSALFGVYYIRKDPSVHYIAVPILFAAIISYLVAHSMLCVYEMVIDTMFLCFVEDVNKNANSQEGYYAPAGLLKFAEEDGKELKPGVPMIAQEQSGPRTVTIQPNKTDQVQALHSAPQAGFVYPHLIESSH